MNADISHKTAGRRRRNIVNIIFFGLVFLTAASGLAGCKKERTTQKTEETGPPETAIIVERPETDTVIQTVEDSGNDPSDDDHEGDNDMNDDPDGESAKEDDIPQESSQYDAQASFYAQEISDEIFARMEGKSYPADCAVAREDLRYLHLLYKDIENNTHEGEMVCNKLIADKLTDIFRKLYEADYPIERMSLIDDFDGDDDASMSANNTSCFNFRVVKGTKKISKHGYGLAVDINPRYNPYIHTMSGETVIEPENGAQYADRTADFDYKIDEDDLAYKLFTEAGFTWGGSWNSVKDYQHFQMD